MLLRHWMVLGSWHSRKGDPMLFQKLFRVLVLGGAVAAGTTGCATSTSAKSADANANATSSDKKAADDATPTDAKADKPTESSGGGGVMGW